jgi:predicted amidohydrolase YtcJ
MGPDGLATGELREFAAFAPILDFAGIGRINLGIATGAEPVAPSAADRAVDKGHLARGLAHAAAQGITTIVNMDGNRYTLELLAEMEGEGRLTARVVVPYHLKPEMPLSDLDRASAMARDFHSDWLRSGFVKMFMDGVVDSRTAYMLQDYPGTRERATPLFEPARFKEVCAEIDRRGLQIAVHAIGDGAVRVTIDGYEAAQLANGKRDSRHRIEHIELIDPADIARLGALGITASVQPPHAPGAMDFPVETMATVFHRGRWKDAYLCRRLHEAGAPLAFASDWPVTDISVMRGLQAALTRGPFGADCTDERLSREACLHAYTDWGAWAAHLETVTGALRPGLAGDLVMVDGDIEAIPVQSLGQTGITLTVAGGTVTHQAPGVL